MSDVQGRHAAPSGRHLAPDTGTAERRSASAPRHSASTPRHSMPEDGLSRQDRAPEEERKPRHSLPEEEPASQSWETEDELSQAFWEPEDEFFPPYEEPEEAERPRRRSAPEPERSRRRSAPAKGKKRPKRRRTVFKTFLLVYLVILGLCTAYLQIRLWVYLDQSQSAMDQAEAEEKALFQAPQLAFERWRDEQTAEDWLERWYAVSPPNDMEPREWLTGYLDRLFSPEDSQAYKDRSYSAAAPVYLIKNGDQSLARVSLTGQGLNWTVSDVELLMDGGKTAVVTVPNSCSVTFNGKPLDASLRQPAESLMQYDLLRDELETPVTWVSYTVEGLLAEPEVTVTPPDGFELMQNDDGAYLLTLASDGGDYADRAVSFVRAFLNYYMNGYHNTWYNRSTVLAFLREDTQAYQEVMDTYDSVSWASYYLNIDTSKTYAGDVIVWANNCFSIDVTYDADATMMGEAVDYANATMRVYYMKSGDGFYISHFETL